MLTAAICWTVAEWWGEMDDGWIPWLNLWRADKRIANDEADLCTMKLMSNDYHRHHHYCWLCCFWKDRWVGTFIITAVHCSCPPSSPPSTFGQWCQCILPWGQTPPQQEHEHRIDLASCLSEDDFDYCDDEVDDFEVDHMNLNWWYLLGWVSPVTWLAYMKINF